MNKATKLKATLFVGLGFLGASGWAATPTAAVVVPAVAAPAVSNADDAFNFFLQEAQVVTASRRAQKKSDSPVAIDIITREEIESSGARSIYDLLRFRVGLDVVEGNSIEGNPAQVNIRGLPEEFSQSLQVLIDGRSVVSVQNSGVSWRRLPISIDEIERIEIVRGPNSALFGANAGQGVINIISIKPGSGSKYKAEVGTLGQRKGLLAVDSGPGAFAARGSYEIKGNSSSFNVVNEQPSPGNETNSNTKMNVRLIGPLADGSDMDFSAGRSDIRFAYPVALGVGGSTTSNNDFQMLRLTQVINEKISLEGAGWRRYEELQSSLGNTKELIYDVDLLTRASFLDDKSKVVAGISGREGFVDSPGSFSDTNAGSTLYAYKRVGDEVKRQQHQRRAYISDQISLAEWVNLALAASYEGSDTGGQQGAYQGAFIFKPLENSTLRLSGSRSPTTPSLLNKYGRLELVTGLTYPYPGPFPPAAIPRLSVIRVQGTDMTSPQLSSFESTFSTNLLERRVTFETTGYQMEISGYPEFTDNTSFSFLFPGSIPEKVGSVVYYRNTYDLVMRGLETQVTYKPAVGTLLQVNHTYEDVQVNKASTRYSYTTPWNKVNALASTDLWYGIHVAGAIGWQGQHYATLPSKSATIFVPDQAKIDARIGYTPVKDVELYAVGTNLDHALRTESPDGMASTQSYAGGINIAWGGSSK